MFCMSVLSDEDDSSVDSSTGQERFTMKEESEQPFQCLREEVLHEQQRQTITDLMDLVTQCCLTTVIGWFCVC